MLKYQAERNWANNVHELRGKYNLPLNDENVCNLTYSMWKKMVHDRVKYVAFSSLRCAQQTKRLVFYYIINSLKHHTLQVLSQKLLAWCSEQELVSMISKKILRKSMMVNYPVPFVDNLLSSLSTYSNATQEFFVRSP